MMDTFDVILVDLQDLGCRIYTFVTTLRYVLEAAAKHGKAVWVLDRPNPVGPAGRRPDAARGLGKLRRRRAAADAPWADARRARRRGSSRRSSSMSTIASSRCEGWQPDAAPGFGWPLGERAWINPSPNAPNLWMARAYAGTVMLEGTTLSEGRGTTRPLELFGAPDIDARALMQGDAGAGAALAARLPAARVLVRADVPQARRQAVQRRADPHRRSRLRSRTRSSPGASRRSPSRRSAVSIPDYPLWRDFAYEYEHGKLAIDVINGGPLLREWVDDAAAMPAGFGRAGYAGRAELG